MYSPWHEGFDPFKISMPEARVVSVQESAQRRAVGSPRHPTNPAIPPPPAPRPPTADRPRPTPRNPTHHYYRQFPAPQASKARRTIGAPPPRRQKRRRRRQRKAPGSAGNCPYGPRHARTPLRKRRIGRTFPRSIISLSCFSSFPCYGTRRSSAGSP